MNRADKGDGYLVASANYAANTNKCQRVLGVNMPTNRHAISKVIREHEEGLTRKNARLGDKILLSLPVELSEAHRYAVTRRFLWSITGHGQSRAVAFYHADKPHNPHMHVMLLDRSVADGKPVMHMGASRNKRVKLGLEPNPTEWLRKVWESECNSVLAEFGYELRIDRRNYLERGAEPPDLHRGPDNDNVRDGSIEALEVAPDVDSVSFTETVSEDAGDGDEAMVDEATIERTPDASVSLAANDIRLLASTVTELNRLRHAQTQLAEAQARHAHLVAQRERTALDASLYEQTSLPVLQNARAAQERLQKLSKANGKLKGVGLQIFGYSYKSRTRREAEEAARRLEAAEYAAEDVRITRRDRAHAVDVATEEARLAEENALMLKRSLESVYGSDKDIKTAQQDFERTVLKVTHNVPLEYAREAFLNVEITPDEYQTYLEQAGHSQELADFLANRDKYVVIDTDEGMEP